MFSSISNTWADLFKAKTTSNIEAEQPQCLHEISSDWICVDEAQNCEAVNDLGKHEILDEDTKERRAQWQKRLQKGRSKRHNSMPSKAKLRKASTASYNTTLTQTQTTSSNTPNGGQQAASLKAKLRLAVEAAQQQDEGVSSPVFTEARQTKIPSKKGPRIQNHTAQFRRMPIQQPCQRGMN